MPARSWTNTQRIRQEAGEDRRLTRGWPILLNRERGICNRNIRPSTRGGWDSVSKGIWRMQKREAARRGWLWCGSLVLLLLIIEISQLFWKQPIWKSKVITLVRRFCSLALKIGPAKNPTSGWIWVFQRQPPSWLSPPPLSSPGDRRNERGRRRWSNIY